MAKVCLNEARFSIGLAYLCDRCFADLGVDVGDGSACTLIGKGNCGRHADSRTGAAYDYKALFEFFVAWHAHANQRPSLA